MFITSVNINLLNSIPIPFFIHNITPNSAFYSKHCRQINNPQKKQNLVSISKNDKIAPKVKKVIDKVPMLLGG